MIASTTSRVTASPRTAASDCPSAALRLFITPTPSDCMTSENDPEDCWLVAEGICGMRAALAISVSSDVLRRDQARPHRSIRRSLAGPQQVECHRDQFTGLLDGLKIGLVGAVCFAHVGQFDEHIDVRQLDHAVFVGGRVARVVLNVEFARIVVDLGDLGPGRPDRTVELPGETDGLAAVRVGARRIAGRLRVGKVFRQDAHPGLLDVQAGRRDPGSD